MNIKKKCRGIEFKTLVSILFFNIGIILIIWICEVVVFNSYYKSYKLEKVNEIVREYNTSKEDIYVLSENLAYENEVCIKVINEHGVDYNFNTMQNGCLLNKNNQVVDDKIKSYLTSGELSDYYKIFNKETNTKGLLYAFKSGNKNVFIYTNLQNINRYVKLFKSQIVYFIVLIILCSIFISFYIANKVTKPIREINTKVKKLGMGEDITFPKNGVNEIDELSETLEDVQKELKKNDEVKRDLIANVSHDLKTPLTMIKAYAEMIKDISYKDQDKMNEHLDIIMEESDRLTTLVNDVLELSKVQNNVYNYNYVEYDLVKEIKKIIKRYSVMESLESYNFVLDLPKKCLVTADKDKINQVIYNLLNNAINYTGKDKVVKIILKEVELGYLVEVSDTGKGIKKEEIPYIWDKYYKNEKNHTRSVVSTGLGLSIVKEILSKHNFKYGVNSEVGKGSTFYFIINKKFSQK